ncbi:MAG: hypothetical protein WCT03_00360 [Candidatus Obscuribacterales bacterium]|jgi:hypothetical protein|nr:hypothetical protein [Candidatus Obscuribacterales bacterium]
MKLNIASTTAASALLILLLSGCSNSAKTSDSTVAKAVAPVASTAAPTDAPVAKKEAAASGGVYLGTINGVISDSMCGKDHSKMGGATTDPAACAAKCVAGGAKYVLVDAKGDMYGLSDQDKAKEVAGKQVAITGHIDPTEKSVHVHSIVTQ